jgi:methionine-rich copper-binding protein CopC
MDPRRGYRRIVGVALGTLMALALVGVAWAHAELETSIPAKGATVPSPFDGPIVLTFSAALADGSKADVHGPDGMVIASAKIDGKGARMTITLDTALAAGDYEVKWVSVAEDGDLLRGTIAFTITPAPPSPTPTPEPTPSPSPSASASVAVSTPPPTIAAASPSASPAPVDGAASSTGDVVLPIIVALIVVGAGAAYLLTRRNRPATRG